MNKSLLKRFFAVSVLVSFHFSATLKAAVVNVRGGTNPYLTIQAGIDAAAAGDTVKVYPGNYDEVAADRYITSSQGQTGPYQFGLFFDASKPGISVIGVDNSGNPVTDYNNAGADVKLNATNNFGTSGVFVNANNITITGLNLYQNPALEQNKTVEVIGENLTIKYCRLTDGNSLYINDWRFNGTTSYVTKYTIEGNSFESGTSIDVADGAGYSGDVSGRVIKNNVLDVAGNGWAMVSFNGSGTGVPWFVNPVGGAVITGNTFKNGEQYIRQRGTVRDADFNWQQYFNNNTFYKSVITLANEGTFSPRTYSYQSGDYNFFNVKRIGAIIQSDIDDIAQNGDVIRAGAGTYNEVVVVKKQVSIKGAQAGVQGKGRSGAESVLDPNSSADNGFKIVTDNVTIDGFTITNSAAYPSNTTERNGVITIEKTGTGNFTGIKVKNNIISRQFKAVNLNYTDNFDISRNWLHGENDDYNYGCTWVSSYGASSTDGIITNNDLDGYGSAIEIQGNLTHPVSNVTISENRSTGSQYVLFGLQNSTIYRNTVLNVTTGTHVYIGGGCTNDLISENFFDNGSSNGVSVDDSYGAGINSDLTITNNRITGHNNNGRYEIKVIPAAYAGSLSANCNWYGTVNSDAIASKISGPVNYVPYLTNGADNSAATPGFQPVPNSCNGTPDDNDGDGVPNGTDCGPYDSNVGAPNTFYADIDKDGFGDINNKTTNCSSTPPAGYVSDSSDCDDTKATYADNDHDGYGAGPKTPCGVSNNTDCNDNNSGVHSPITYYRDSDLDGFGNINKKTTACSATPPSGYVKDSSDCDDTKATYADNDHDGYGAGLKTPCGVGNNNDCNDNNANVHSSITYYRDYDHDGYGDPNKSVCVCSSSAPSGYVKDRTDCNDHDGSIHSPKTYYRDYDKDGFGDPKNKICVCASKAPSGYVSKSGDCNDHNKNINPGMKEIPNNHIDDNCNGKTDEKTSSREIDEKTDVDTDKSLIVSVSPNPSPTNFTMNVKSGSDEKIQLRVIDATGRLLEVKPNITANSTFKIGDSYLQGIYFAEVMQGTERVIVKCVKQ